MSFSNDIVLLSLRSLHRSLPRGLPDQQEDVVCSQCEQGKRVVCACCRGRTPDSGRFPYGSGLRATLSGRYRFVLTKPAGVGATLWNPDEYIGMPLDCRDNTHTPRACALEMVRASRVHNLYTQHKHRGCSPNPNRRLTPAPLETGPTFALESGRANHPLPPQGGGRRATPCLSVLSAS